MKYLNIDTFEQMTDSEVEELINTRAKKVTKVLREKVLGQTFEGFGPKSKGIWAEPQKTIEFKIKNIQQRGSFMYSDKRNDNDDRVCVNLDILLENYNSNETGLLYTCDVAEKKLTQLFKTALQLKNMRVTWTEQGAQGRKYINVHLDMPLKDVAPDVLLYNKYVSETSDLEAQIERIKNKFDTKLATASDTLIFS